MNRTQTQEVRSLPSDKIITITLMMMGTPQHAETFYSKAKARVYFANHHQSDCCYALVSIDGKELASITDARRYFGIKGESAIPWSKQSIGGRKK